jgi:hypothetical protein
LRLHRSFDEALLGFFGHSLIWDPLIGRLFGMRLWRFSQWDQ